MTDAKDPLLTLIREQSSPFPPIPTELARSQFPIKGIRHIAFDVYGTLFSSGVGDIGNSAPADRGAALHTVLADAGIDPLPSPRELETLYLAEIQNSQAESTARGAQKAEVEIRDVWRSLVDRIGGRDTLPDSLIPEIALRFELAVNPVWPMPHLVEVLELLAMRFAPYTIVSNAQFFTPLLFPALTGKSLAELHFLESACVWSYLAREAKPSPRLFESLIEHLSPTFRPAEILYVGNDMLNDISAAQKAGLRTALFAGDQRSLRLREDHPDCQGVQPDLILTSLADLPKLV
ncbi:MAG: HAD family hydrolase [Puniceicoccales bacterium]